MRQVIRLRVCHSIGAAMIDSSNRTAGTVTCGPSSSASGGDITIAPPKPVMPRTMPATNAIATDSASVSAEIAGVANG